MLSAASAFAHDFYSHILRKGAATEKEQVVAARWASIGVSILSIILALFAQNMNVAFLVALAFAVAASANLPIILLTIFGNVLIQQEQSLACWLDYSAHCFSCH